MEIGNRASITNLQLQIKSYSGEQRLKNGEKPASQKDFSLQNKVPMCYCGLKGPEVFMVLKYRLLHGTKSSIINSLR
jgi:hypothetical protein